MSLAATDHAAVAIGRARNTYLDTLRALALGRVILLHSFFVGWTSFLVPSMGIMFALGGSLTAASLTRSSSKSVFIKRATRVLVPFWAFAAVAVAAMLLGGWASEPDTSLSIGHLVSWLLPVVAPIGSAHWDLLWRPLWYLSTYLWLVLLTPVLLRVYRASPRAAVVVSVLVGALIPAELLKQYGLIGSSILDLCSYGGFWILGFAHHFGHLQKISNKVIALVSVVSFAIAIAAISHYRSEGRLELTMHPLVNMAWSLPFMLVLLRWNPSMSWLENRQKLKLFVQGVNRRAVTIYLWHSVAILVAIAAATSLLSTNERLVTLSFSAIQLPITAAVLVGLVVLFGPVEDRAKYIRPLQWFKRNQQSVR